MFDERGKEIKENDEVESLKHFSHRHPLILSKTGWRRGDCDGCANNIYSEETAYLCPEGCLNPVLHEECAIDAAKDQAIDAPSTHPYPKPSVECRMCAVCEVSIRFWGYSCASSDGCGFHVHVGCAQNVEVLQSYITHPSHPQHQMASLLRPGRSCSSRCDACGTIEKGNSYICFVCQYWINDSCAHLSATAQFDCHDHPLSLIYCLMLEYIKYGFACDICLKALLPKYWVYHCEDCRFVVHIKYAINTTERNVVADKTKDEDEGIIAFPINNVVEMLVEPFVRKAAGVMLGPNESYDSGTCKFHSHDHKLHLIKSSLHHQENDQEEEDDDDDFDNSKLVCDGCTMPIFPKKQPPSDKIRNYYLSCGECKYFLHWSCFHLPPQIPSYPLHSIYHNNPTLQTCSKIDLILCRICKIYTNGLFYGCTQCDFKVDTICASLPITIKHQAHPRHPLQLIDEETRLGMYYEGVRKKCCGACGGTIYDDDDYDTIYACPICEIIFHTRCALLPAVVTNPGWDKHPFRLTFGAREAPPSSLYCVVCEKEMDPELWMYHCGDCDISVHPDCFPTASGKYRNIKLGQQYDVSPTHDHPVALQLLTGKLHCDVCGQKKEYGSPVFQCAKDKCEFFMCADPCAAEIAKLPCMPLLEI